MWKIRSSIIFFFAKQFLPATVLCCYYCYCWAFVIHLHTATHDEPIGVHFDIIPNICLARARQVSRMSWQSGRKWAHIWWTVTLKIWYYDMVYNVECWCERLDVRSRARARAFKTNIYYAPLLLKWINMEKGIFRIFSGLFIVKFDLFVVSFIRLRSRASYLLGRCWLWFDTHSRLWNNLACCCYCGLCYSSICRRPTIDITL